MMFHLSNQIKLYKLINIDKTELLSISYFKLHNFVSRNFFVLMKIRKLKICDEILCIT